MVTGVLGILIGILGCLLVGGVVAVLARGLSRRRHRGESDDAHPGQTPGP
jgi:hypothetical protein